MPELKTIGVVGCGLMGSGIAQISAQAGYKTVVREVSDEFLKKGLGKIEDFLNKGVEKGKVKAEDRDATLKNLKGTTRLEDLKDCGLIIEAVIENLEEKKKLYAALDGICGKEAVFASNTSSLSITEMSAATKRLDRFGGLHFFNPVPLMKLVEVVRTINTSDATAALLTEFAKKTGKTPIQAPDRPGFIVNRLLVPYILDAIRALEEGAGTKEDIDLGMKLGCGYPMGPFELLDFVGLDTTYYIANIMFDEFKEPRFAPPVLLKRMVASGQFGKKSGRGFYDYPAK
jgi:3-hydroxybutyryl-CoA dehydrogenase